MLAVAMPRRGRACGRQRTVQHQGPRWLAKAHRQGGQRCAATGTKFNRCRLRMIVLGLSTKKMCHVFLHTLDHADLGIGGQESRANEDTMSSATALLSAGF